jgi:hypothetical protein
MPGEGHVGLPALPAARALGRAGDAGTVADDGVPTSASRPLRRRRPASLRWTRVVLHGGGAGGVGQRLAGPSAPRPPLHHRQAHAQAGSAATAWVERDAHRHALHHLDPVAGGVLRRQQRESGTGAGAHAGHGALVFDLAAVHVGHQLHRLADAELAQLHFLEVGVDPDLAERHDRHQRRAGGTRWPSCTVRLAT